MTNSNREKSSNNYDVIETIIDCVAKGDLIPIDKMGYLSSQHYDLIDGINDLIMSTDKNNEANKESYSKLRKSVENLRKVKQELIDENKRLKEENSEKEKELETLKTDNELKDNLISNIANSFNEYNVKVKRIGKISSKN